MERWFVAEVFLLRILLSCRLHLGRCNTRNVLFLVFKGKRKHKFRNLHAFLRCQDLMANGSLSWKAAARFASVWLDCDCDNCGAAPWWLAIDWWRPQKVQLTANSRCYLVRGFQKHQSSSWSCLVVAVSNIFFVFHHYLGKMNPFWLIFFKWVETIWNHQLVMFGVIIFFSWYFLLIFAENLSS